MKSKNRVIRKIFFAGLLIFLFVTTTVLAQTTQAILIDGSFDDWIDKVFIIDPGGADDETSPERADVTEFRASADSNGLYLLKTWDDTDFGNGQASTAGVTVEAADGSFYRIYNTAELQGSVPVSSLDINGCTDFSCGTENPVCDGVGCTGAEVASGITWSDPFSSRVDPLCDDIASSCGTFDTAAEIFIPWSFIGGLPNDGEAVFLDYSSYPSGPGQGQKDVGFGGIVCLNTDGNIECSVEEPTAAVLGSFSTTPLAGEVIVEWNASSEFDTQGFNLFRSTSIDGDLIQVNSSLLPNLKFDAPFLTSYQHIDDDVKPGVTYYYWLEVQNSDGQQLYGPISAKALHAVFLPLSFGS